MKSGTLVSLFLIFMFMLWSNKLHSQPSKDDWKKELRKIQSAIDSKHVNPYHKISKDELNQEFDKLINSLTNLNDYQVILELYRIVALIGDGHTSFNFNDQQLVKFNYFPVKFYQFDDGIFVIGASHQYPQLVGAKLIKIDELEIEKITEIVAKYIPRDNDYAIAYGIPFFLNNTEELFYSGITKSIETANYAFVKNRDTIHVSLNGIPGDVYFRWPVIPSNKSLGDSCSGKLTYMFSNDFTRTHIKSNEDYWVDTIPGKKTVFFQYNSSWDQDGRPTVKSMIDKTAELLKLNNEYKLVIDLRYNSGGEPDYLKPLVELVANEQRFKTNKAIVLVGVRTFSAAMTNACQLKQTNNCILIGQYSRAKPNNPSEGRFIEFKKVKLRISISAEQIERYPKLGNSMVLPMDKIIPVNFSDFKNNIDKTFEEAVESKF